MTANPKNPQAPYQHPDRATRGGDLNAATAKLYAPPAPDGNPWKVYRDGKPYASHPDYSTACRSARNGAQANRLALFTVFYQGMKDPSYSAQAGESGLPVYIATTTKPNPKGKVKH